MKPVWQFFNKSPFPAFLENSLGGAPPHENVKSKLKEESNEERKCSKER